MDLVTTARGCRSIPAALRMVALAAVAIVATLLAAPAFAAAPANRYESDLYPFALTWGGIWTVADRQTADGADYLRLEDGYSSVELLAYRDGRGLAGRCVKEAVAALGLASTDPAEFYDGTTLESSYVGQPELGGIVAWVATGYLECRTLVPNDAVLLIYWTFPADELMNEYPAVQALLAGIELPQAAASPTPAPAPGNDGGSTAAGAANEPPASSCPPNEGLIADWRDNAEQIRETAARIDDPLDREPFMIQADQWDQKADDWELACASAA